MNPPSPINPRLRVPFWLAQAIARMARLATRISGRGGTSLPGNLLLRLCPTAMQRLAQRQQGRVVLVSATNGKTTVTAMLATICEQAGMQIVHNMAGANLRSGLATTLLTAARDADVVLLETDEATLPLVAPDLQPDVIVLANLFRDQLDRYGELEALADRWSTTLMALDAERVTICANADDPLIAELVDTHLTRAREAGVEQRVVMFGCEDASVAAPGLPHAADSKFCRRCGAPLVYEHSYVGHLGSWRCAACGLERPHAEVRAVSVELDGLAASRLELALPDGATVKTRLRIPGLYNAYNGIAAAAAAHAIGIGAPTIAAGLAEFSPAFGRFERIPIPGIGTLTLLLVKNPTGLNEVIRTLVGAGVDLGACLFALNDGIADGRDTSWIWDADVEPLLERAPALVITGERAGEFALRAAYGGADAETLIVEPDIEQALSLVLERARDFTSHGHAYALVTYTAMLRMRAAISAQGWVQAYWRAAAQPGPSQVGAAE